MHYQAALSLLMQEQKISIQTLSKQTNFSVRWLSLILKDSDWNPWLNTLLKLSEALRINVITITEYAEGCNRQENLRTSEPQNLRTSEPQNLRTSEPQNLRTSEPQNLRTSEPQNLRTSEPQNLRTSEPQNLRTSEPQN